MPFKYVLRRLLRSPMFTAITVLTLAIGIGANSAIFSVIEGILLNPLPYPHPQDLIGLDHSAPGVNLPEVGAAPFLYFTYREENRTLADVGMWTANTVTVTGFAEPAEVDSLHVTERTLPILGLQPILGRWFSPQDDTPNSAAANPITAPRMKLPAKPGGVRMIFIPASSFGYSSASLRATLFNPAWACCVVTPGLRRPTINVFDTSLRFR